MNINTLHQNVINGDRDAEERLFEALSVRLRIFVYQRIWNEEDADEVLQDALMTITSEYKGIEFETSFSAWCYAVLKNKIRNYMRKKRRHDERMEPMADTESTFAAWTPDPELEPQLLGCLKEISKYNIKFARILNLKYQGYEVKDICGRLEITSTNLYVILSRARSMLKTCLEKGGIDK